VDRAVRVEGDAGQEAALRVLFLVCHGLRRLAGILRKGGLIGGKKRACETPGAKAKR
jgi:hypothetical protein